MQTMYSVQTGSPELTLASNIDSTVTTIPLNEDVTQLPDAPNIVTIYNTSEETWETIKYESVDTANNELETVTRAFEGTAQSWSSGDTVARLLTSYDIATFKDNITENHNNLYTDEEAQDAVGTIMSGTGSASVTYDDSANTITIDAQGKTDEEIQDIVGNLIVGGTNVTVTYDDNNNTITIDASASGGGDADTVDGWNIQKDGTDGAGIINFKT